MRPMGFLITLLLCTASVLGMDAGPAQAIKTKPGVPPENLQSKRPASPPSEVPNSLKSQIPESFVHDAPDLVRDHREVGPGAHQLPAGVLNHAPQKTGIPHPRPRVARPTSGGDTFGDATPIASLPFNDSGNTCLANDDYPPPCGAQFGPDLVYSYSPESTACIRISLCGSTYDTEVFVVQDTFPNVIACNDDYCGVGSQLDNLLFQPGHTYYIVVDGYGGSCGDYQIVVERCPPPPGPIACPPSALIEGEPVCGNDYVDNYNGGCNNFPENFLDLPCSTDTVRVCGTYGTYTYSGNPGYRDTDWYRVTVNDHTTLHACVTGQATTSIFLLDGRNGCGGTYTLAYNQAAAQQQACIDLAVEGGTYYVVVATTNYDGVECGSNYYMTVLADSCPPPPPPPVCPPNATQEGEPVCFDGYDDNYDAGCNSFPPTFVDVPCEPGTTNICGTYGTYLNQGGQYRDTDWYRIVVNRTSNVQYSVKGEYPTTILVLDGRFGCGGLGLICAQSGVANQTLSCNTTLSPGTYYLFVGTSEFSGRACGGLYVMSVTRDSCPEPFQVTCPPGAHNEGEPVCHDEYNDTYNAGCNSDPPTFISPYSGGLGNNDCVPGTVRVCGTYGTYLYQGGQYRDTDWYQVVLHGNSHLRYCAVGEAATTIFVLDGTQGCNNVGFVCGSSGGPGDTLCCDQLIPAGTYWLFIATSDFAGVNCGSKYVISVTQDSCPQPVQVHCPPGAMAEEEPPCADNYLDVTNGGCNSDPPVFTQVPCANHPTRVCGTYGTYRYGGFDYRDTDWYEFVATEPMHVKFCLVGEAATNIFILNGTGGCPGIAFEASGAGAAGDTICCEADLAPGIHWFFVATTAFSGIPCGSHYVATFTGARCGMTPVAMSVGAIEANPAAGAIQLRWNAIFDGPAEFRVLRGRTANGGYDEVGQVTSATGQHEFSFADRSVEPGTEYFYTIQYRQDGDWMAAGTVHVVSAAGRLAIHAVVPNPTTGASRIEYELPRSSNVRLEIFDVSGHRVRVLLGDHIEPAGTGTAFWDGKNDRGRILPAGAYFVRLATNNKNVVTHRLVLMH